jgi:hypothetical protein
LRNAIARQREEMRKPADARAERVAIDVTAARDGFF